MAVNPQKFLPSKETTKETINIKKSSIVLSQNSVKNIATLKVKVIQIESILKGTLASEKKALDQKKRKESAGRREKQEEKLETRTNMGMGQVKMPQRPKLGIFEWIKNFIGNIILGYFAVRLVEHLPKIMPIVKLLGKAGDLIVDFGGKLLNGLATFIDWGYKAVDFSRGLIGKTFGDDALKNFDKLTSEFEKFMNLAIIVGMASADFGMDRLGRRVSGKGAERAAERGAGTATRRGAGRTLTRTGARLGGRGGAKLASKLGSKVLKAVPLLGAGLAITEGIMRFREGDYVGGLLSFGTAIPIAGWAFLALDIAREFMGGREFDKSVGRALSGKPGLTNKQVQKRTPHFFGPDLVVGVAGGGPTRGGKSKGAVKRTIGKTKKAKYKRVIPQKPGKVEITSPGVDVGGEDKIFGIFPNPLKGAQKFIDAMNPFNTLKKSGEELGKTDYFGPILAITSKLLAGQKPSQQDYQNVGLGINMLIAKGIQDKQLKGGVVAAFAEGGMVDPDVLSAAETGGDISNWVAKTFQGEIESNAQRTLRLIKENAEKKKYEVQKDKSVNEISPGEDFGGSATDGIGGARLFMAAGFPTLASAILAGNVQQESGWKGQRTPWVLNDGAGTNKGLISWNRSRIVNAEKFLGKPLEKASNAEQVKWIKEELRQYGLLKVFMDPNSTEQQLKDASYKYIGWGDVGDRWKYSSQIFAALQRGEKGTFIPSTTAGGGIVKPTGANGRLSPGQLTAVQGGYQLRSDAAQAFQNASAAARKSGVNITLSSAYRSYEKQAALYANRANNPYPVAAPGTSNHGYGIAVDVPEGTPGHNWMIANGRQFGWKNLPGDAVHFDFVGGSGMKSYHTGSNKINSKETIAKLLKKESVLDVDTSESLRKIDPQLIGKLNRATNVQGVMNVLQQYASYESGAEQTVVVIDSTPTTSMGGGYGDSGAVMMMGGSGGESDPFESLAIGG